MVFGTGEKIEEKLVKNKDGTVDKIETKTIVTRKLDGTKVTKRKVVRSRTPNPNQPLGGSSHHSTASASKGGDAVRRVKSGTMGGPNSLEKMKQSVNNIAIKKHSDNAAFEKDVLRCIPSEFLLIASQDEVNQSQEDYFALKNYLIPPLASAKASKNMAGSVATCALIELLHEKTAKMVAPKSAPMDCKQVLDRLQKRIKQASKLDAKPTISSSRILGPPRGRNYSPFTLVAPKATGTRRALLIGVLGQGRGGLLKAPPNDIALMRRFLKEHAGFEEKNITVLLEDPSAPGDGKSQPTRANILAGFAKLVRGCRANDSVVIQYSGHGGRTTHNLHLVPSDFNKAGGIRDEDIMKLLIKAMPANVHTTMVVDCCFSGTMADLPYVLKSNARGQEIEIYFDTDTRAEMIQKEKMGGEAYQKYKRTRANQRFLMNLSPMKMIEDAAAVAGAAAHATADAARKSAAVTADAAKKSAAVTAEAAKKSAAVTADAAKRTSDAAKKSAAVTADAAKKSAAVTADAAKKSAAVTAEAAKKSADAAKKSAAVTAEAAKKSAAATAEVAKRTSLAASEITKRTSLAASEAAKRTSMAALGGAKRTSLATLEAAKRTSAVAGRASTMSKDMMGGTLNRFSNASMRFSDLKFGDSIRMSSLGGSSELSDSFSMDDSSRGTSAFGRESMSLGRLAEDSEDEEEDPLSNPYGFKKTSNHSVPSMASTASTSSLTSIGSTMSAMSNVAKGGANAAFGAAMGGANAMTNVAKGGVGSATAAVGGVTEALKRGVARNRSNDGSKPMFGRTNSSDGKEREEEAPKRRGGKKPLRRNASSDGTSAGLLAKMSMKPNLLTKSSSNDDDDSPKKFKTPARSSSSDGMMNTMPMTRRAGKKPTKPTASPKASPKTSPKNSPKPTPKKCTSGSPKASPKMANPLSGLRSKSTGDGSTTPTKKRGISPMRSKPKESEEDRARREAVERSRREAAEARAAARMARV